MQIDESEIVPFLDSEGFLSVENRNKFLESKKVIKIKNNEPIVLYYDVGGEQKNYYQESIGQIEKIMKNRFAGKIGTTIQKVNIDKKVNDINADDIPF